MLCILTSFRCLIKCHFLKQESLNNLFLKKKQKQANKQKYYFFLSAKIFPLYFVSLHGLYFVFLIFIKMKHLRQYIASVQHFYFSCEHFCCYCFLQIYLTHLDIICRVRHPLDMWLLMTIS